MMKPVVILVSSQRIRPLRVRPSHCSLSVWSTPIKYWPTHSSECAPINGRVTNVFWDTPKWSFTGSHTEVQLV